MFNRNRNTKNINKFCNINKGIQEKNGEHVEYLEQSNSCKVNYNSVVTGGNDPKFTKSMLYSRISRNSNTYSTMVQYNKDNIVNNFQYLASSLTSITFSFIAKPFVMRCIIQLIPDNKSLPTKFMDINYQMTKNKSQTFEYTFNNLDSVSNYTIIISGTDIFNMTTTLVEKPLFKGPIGFIGQKGIRGPTGIGKQGDMGSTGQYGATGPTGKVGQIGSFGSLGSTGPTGLDGMQQLWNMDASLNINSQGTIFINNSLLITNNNKLIIGDNNKKQYVMNVRNNLTAKSLNISSEFNFKNLSIGKIGSENNTLDISGNIYVSTNLAVYTDTTDKFNMDISGSVNIEKEILISKLYRNYGTPLVVDDSTILLDYNTGDEYYFNVGENIINNFTCSIINLPIIFFTPFVITIMNDYSNYYSDLKYYCNNIIIGDTNYTLQFNSKIPILQNIFIQKFTIIYFGPNNIQIFCDIFNYT